MVINATGWASGSGFTHINNADHVVFVQYYNAMPRLALVYMDDLLDIEPSDGSIADYQIR